MDITIVQDGELEMERSKYVQEIIQRKQRIWVSGVLDRIWQVRKREGSRMVSMYQIYGTYMVTYLRQARGDEADKCVGSSEKRSR